MRLGKGGCDEVKAHSWFKDFDWEGLKKFEVVAPFIPESDDNFDKHYCNKKEVEGNETLERYSIYKQSELYIHAFFNYTCNDTIYRIGFIDTKVIRSADQSFWGRNCLTFTHSGPAILDGNPRSEYEGLSEEDMDNLLFQRINEMVSHIEGSKIKEQQKLDEQRIKMEQSKYASEYRRGYHQDAPPKTIFDNEDPSYFN